MPKLEPIYLRYVYDSLKKGALNAENASALPHGFIGLYEQEFTQKTPAGERKKVLHQLALWALFKGPVSANMAAAVLELEEEQMKDLVDAYSSWFNSPESGKYQLYHERLRVYILQKLKAEEVQVLNEKLISFLEDAIKQANGEEDEYYALEHLNQHMALESQLGNHYDRLHSYVNQESLWRRQIQLSKGYAWSQNAVQLGIKEGARRNHEMNTIRSTVNSVKLMTQEQNSAEDILNLLNEGDYLTALKRAESWEGERQFKLYLLFIHELTIGTSSEADFRKEACKAVLEAIDQTPEDLSVLDWCKFYPELAIYKYHEELLKMELDGMVIWKRGNYTLSDISEWNTEICNDLASEITDDSGKSLAYREISKVLMEHGKMKESQEAMKESLKVASEITDDFKKYRAYREISKVLMEQGKMKESQEVIKESLKVASEITDDSRKSLAYREISKVLMEQGKMKESLEVASLITNENRKSEAYSEISKVLMEQGKMKESQEAMKESLKEASEITDDSRKSLAYREISKVLMEQGKMKESLKVASEINDDSEKSLAYSEISKVLMEQGKMKESQEAMKESLKEASEITEDLYKSEAYSEISKVLMAQGKMKESQEAMKESLKVASEVTHDYGKSRSYRIISKILMEQGKMKESLEVASLITNENRKSEAYREISRVLMEQGKMKESLEAMKESLKVASEMTIVKEKEEELYIKISTALMEQGKMKESLIVASDIDFDYWKSEAYREISKVLMEQGKMKESQEALKESLKVASEITNDYFKSLAYSEIAKVLMEQGKMKESQEALKESLKVASEITNDYFKSLAYIKISKVLMEQGKMKESLKVASEITDDYYKSEAFREISKVLIEQGKMKESLKVASEITDDYYKSIAYGEISKVLMEQGKMKESQEALKESLKVASEITNDFWKSEAYSEISKVLMEQGKRNEAIQIAEKIKRGSVRSETFNHFGKTLAFEEAQNTINTISSQDNQSAVIKGMSEKINEELEISTSVNPYLYNHSDQIQNLSNILFYQAKMACFFEDERNEEKLDILSEVIDIKDWRRISASA